MSERKERTRNSDADRSPERIKDPKAGLDRLQKALKHILTVPKEAIRDDGDDGKAGRS
jgi:hypothetical protein